MRTAHVAALAAALVLTACGSGSGGTATDPGGSVSPTASSPGTPEASPTVGSYPPYEPQDYAFTLRVQCFCAGVGTPIRVTVVDGEVTDAVYAKNGRGVRKGDPADARLAVTIEQVIEAANDTEAASVQVRWPDGQDYPSSVYVDRDKDMADEEIGYAVSDVTVG
jgi:hypothetical protein